MDREGHHPGSNEFRRVQLTTVGIGYLTACHTWAGLFLAPWQLLATAVTLHWKFGSGLCS